jgi:Nif-specific regulatory protein
MGKTIPEEQIEMLQATTNILAEAADRDQMLRSILKMLSEKLKLDYGTITLLDESTKMINISLAHGLSQQAQELGRYRLGEGITGKVVQTGRSVIIPDIERENGFLHRTGARLRSPGHQTAFLCVPIKFEGKTIGALSVDKKVSGHRSLDDDLRILKIMAPMIAQAIKLTRRVEKEKKNLEDENLRLKQECHAGGLPHDRTSGGKRNHGFNPRRKRHGQGTGRPCHSLRQPEGAKAFYQGQLQCFSGKPAGKRIIRT